MELIINAHQAIDGRTHGCIYSAQNGKLAEVPCCYTYRFHEGKLYSMIWVGNDLVAED